MATVTSGPRMAIVTGAGRGIGKACARDLAQAGSAVVIAEIDGEAAQAAAAELNGLGVAAVAYVTDVADEASVQGMVDATLGRFGRIDILITNAAVISPGTVLEMSVDEWDRVLDVDLRGVFLCGRAAARHMVHAGAGCIVNITSISSQRGVYGRGNYVVAKAGVIALTRVMAIEWAKHGVRVNAVAPGFVSTELQQWAQARGITDMEEIARVTPMGRIAEPAEIADVVAFLTSDRATTLPEKRSWLMEACSQPLSGAAVPRIRHEPAEREMDPESS